MNLQLAIKIFKNTLVLFLIVLLSIIAANRGDTRDTVAYIDFFNEFKSFESLTSPPPIEYGFVLFSYIFNAIDLPYSVFFFSITFISLLSIILAARNFSVDNVVCIFYYFSGLFVTQQLMQIRQGIALPLAFLGISFLFTKKTFKKTISILLIILSISHHISAALPVIVFFFYLFIRNKITFSSDRIIKESLLIIIALFFIFHFFPFEKLFSFHQRFSIYNNPDEAINIISAGNLKFILIFFVTLFTFKISKEKPSKTEHLLIFYMLIGISIRFSFIDIPIISGRLSNALLFVEIFLIPVILKRLMKNNFSRKLVTIKIVTLHFFINALFINDYVFMDYFNPI